MQKCVGQDPLAAASEITSLKLQRWDQHGRIEYIALYCRSASKISRIQA
jgi:hypothetical protein